MKKYLTAAMAFLLLASCNSQKKIVYFQDLKPEQVEEIVGKRPILVEPGDQLQILVSCKDPELSAILNMPLVSYHSGTNTNLSTTNSIVTYTVDQEGNIDFPIIGSLKVQGLSRELVRDLITGKIKEAQLIQDFVVTVNYSNMKIYIMGEVGAPGTYSIQDNNPTLLQAISMAHDLTIYGRRDQVYVIRDENNQRVSYKFDLRSDSVFQSPGFYLKQNDVIYVAPTRVRANQSSLTANSLRSPSLWVSVASVLATLYVAFMK